MSASGAPARSKPFVKVCGVTSPGDAVMAVEAGAHAIGVVLWKPSPRAIALPEARAIREAIGGRAVLVGVFVNAEAGEMLAAVDAAGLDVVQLHGDERSDMLVSLDPLPVMKAISGEALSLVDEWPSSVVLLVDAHEPVRRGGTGRRASWDAARALAVRRAVVLAGGLDAANLVEAVSEVAPVGVDVSSGVEGSPGRKDPARLTAFFDAWRCLPGDVTGLPFRTRPAPRDAEGHEDS